MLLEGLYDEGSPLSMLLGVRHDVMGEIIWKQMLVSKWQAFPVTSGWMDKCALQ